MCVFSLLGCIDAGVIYTVLVVPGKLVSLRVDVDLWLAVGVRAEALGLTKTAVVQAALEQALGDDNQAASSAGASEQPSHTGHHASAAGAVPARVAPRPSAPARASSQFSEFARARQEKLNEAKYGRKR